MSTTQASDLPLTPATDTTVDLVVVGSGTGLAAALSAHEAGLEVLVVEKSQWVGGSTCRSGGAFWIPGNAVLREQGSDDSVESARIYLENLVDDVAPRERWEAYLEHGAATVDMMRRTTPMKFIWARGYSDYHTLVPGSSELGRTVECAPFDLSVLGQERRRLHPTPVEAPVPIPLPITSPDFRWMNLMAVAPSRALPKIITRVTQGVAGMAMGRYYTSTGVALSGGLYAGVLQAGIPLWTEAQVVGLETTGGGDAAVTGVRVRQGEREVVVTARRGVVLGAGGFDHDAQARAQRQSPSLDPHWPLGAPTNTGDLLGLATALGAQTAFLGQAWWFPSVAPIHEGELPKIALAERSLPGSFMVDRHGRRFVNESVDYMTFGQEVLRREQSGDPVGDMWLVFDQRYRNSYVFATELFPRMPIPQAWKDAGVAVSADDAPTLAAQMGVPVEAFVETGRRFNEMARAGVDEDFARGDAAYDRYYGDPTHGPNPNLRPLDRGPLHAVRMVLSDLGTCGGLQTDADARVLRSGGGVIEGLYAIGNNAANVFGNRYPGAGATIGGGLIMGHVAAQHAARR